MLPFVFQKLQHVANQPTYEVTEIETSLTRHTLYVSTRVVNNWGTDIP